MRLVLASASPRRRALLEEAGIAFLVAPADVEEWAPERGDPHAVARENALRKARAVAGDPVVGADTVVALDNVLLGKPRDLVDARRILELLRGRTHAVVTGLALTTGGASFVSSVETKVTMGDFSATELDEYVATGECMGKAGAYAIQGAGGRLVASIDGPFDNVVGLPVAELRAMLKEAGL